MANCEYGSQLSAYHDGELPPAAHAALEKHLPGCVPCIDELRGLSELSAVLAGAAEIAIPPEALSRLRRQMGRSVLMIGRDRRLLRVAQSLMGLAACLLVGTSLWVILSRHVAVAVGPVSEARRWEQVAVTLQTDIPTTGGTDIAADWVLADASSDGSRSTIGE